MARHIFSLVLGVATLFSCDAFFTPKTQTNVETVTPTTNDELTKALCGKYSGSTCVDTTARKIIINKVFDFRGTDKTEPGCYHLTNPAKCLTSGQMKLNVNNQCNGLTATQVTYNAAGPKALEVGSNKIIVGINGGGLKGKGLKIREAEYVEVRNLSITDINPHVIWGGDAIDVTNSKYVLIDGNYIKNIGRQMIVTHFGTNIVTISNNVFDGNTPNGPFCDGQHYWLWLFLGENERITLQNNIILNTSGRGPHLVASKESKTLLHMIQNTFFNINHMGLIELDDTKSSILMEGNVFYNVSDVVHLNKGNIYKAHNVQQMKACTTALGRCCLKNTLNKCGGITVNNSAQVLTDFQPYQKSLLKPIAANKVGVTSWPITIPAKVKASLG